MPRNTKERPGRHIGWNGIGSMADTIYLQDNILVCLESHQLYS